MAVDIITTDIIAVQDMNIAVLMKTLILKRKATNGVATDVVRTTTKRAPEVAKEANVAIMTMRKNRATGTKKRILLNEAVEETDVIQEKMEMETVILTTRITENPKPRVVLKIN